MSERRRPSARPALAALACAALAACEGSPLQTALNPTGPEARAIFGLWTYFWITATVVFVLVMAATAWALARGHRRAAPDVSEAGEGGARRVVIGAVGVTTVVLLATAVVSFLTGRAYAVVPESGRPLRISVIGHQWWWEAVYDDSLSSRSLTTANEIHIPVGAPVRLVLTTKDVIHSFWVPQLQGKIDLIPGDTNELSLVAKRAGRYQGICSEFCGMEHAKMGLVVVAEDSATFRQWARAQLAEARSPTDSLAVAGQQLFESGPCAMCHTVRGTRAGGSVAPDLTHVGSRSTIAAGSLPNTLGNLEAWIADAQAIKPGALMPTLTTFSGRDLRAVATYVSGLK